MKKFLLTVLAMLLLNNVSYSKEEISNPYDAIYEGYQAVYSPDTETWTAGGVGDDKVVLTKKLVQSMGVTTEYVDEDGNVVISLSTDFEFVKNGLLITVDNANLLYYKIVYNGERFLQVPLSYFELQQAFPDAEVVRLSLLYGNKMWISKKLFSKKRVLFVNDSENCYYKLTAKAKKAQDKEVKGLITLYRYGIFNFSHFGERDGKIIIYVR